MLHRHLHAKRRVEIIAQSRPYPVSQIPYVVERIGHVPLVGDRLLSIEIPLPVFVETISHDSRQASLAHRRVVPIQVVEIPPNGKGQF